MEGIRDLCPLIGWNVSHRAGKTRHVHTGERIKYLPACVSPVQFLLQQPIDQQCCKTGEKVCLDTVIPLEIDRPRFEFRFHNSETFLDLPSSLVDLYDLHRIIFEIRDYGIEAVILFLVPDPAFIQLIEIFFFAISPSFVTGVFMTKR